MRIVKHQITQPLDTNEASRLLGYDPSVESHYRHLASDFGIDFHPEWLERAISILLEKQHVEVSEPTMVRLFDDQGSQIFASLVLVDVAPEYADKVDGKRITRVETIGAIYQEKNGIVHVSELSIDPKICIVRHAILPDRSYLQPVKCFNEL